MSETHDWDGRKQSYRPQPGWQARLPPCVALHREQAEAVDPVTFEVIRQKLWTINIAHGETITRVSGSPVLATLDFNMSILTEDAEVVLNAPYVQFLNAGAPLCIRYILERYAERPGIDEDDIFCCNDPWIGACHQMDVLFAAPIFVDGLLFGWVANAGHQYDLGGIVPGGWPQNAEDVYSDPVVLPPFKLVERGEMRRDLEALYLRQSRVPDLVALDLRAQIAGAVFARDRIVALCTRFGAPVVKTAMRRMLDQAQDGFRRKLARIPDGTWSETRYLDDALPGDRQPQRMQLTVTKSGDRIAVDNTGTDQATPGTNGIPFTTWSGSITGIISVSMLYEQLFAYGGSERQIDYRPTPGLLTCVNHPTATSGGILQSVTMMNAMQSILSRMMACDPDLKQDIVAPCAEFLLPVLIGVDDRGKFFGQAILDAFACGSGARSFGDGIDTSGPTYSPLSMVLNVELVEQWFPILFLYRKEDADSGGAGTWRGGNGLCSAITPYRATSMSVVTNTGGQGVTTQSAPGLFGGYPAPAGHYIVRRQTDLAAWLASGRMPDGIGALAAQETIHLRAKSNGTSLGPGDVFEVRFGGGGGYGDPLLRSPDLVLRDLEQRAISRSTADAAYGVVLTETGCLDRKATDSLRASRRQARAGWRPASDTACDMQSHPPRRGPARPVHEYVVATMHGDVPVLACAQCGHRFCDYDGAYKSGALVDVGPVTTIPTAPDPGTFLDRPFVFRRYCCPGCRVQIATEIAPADEAPNAETRLSRR